MRRIYPILVGLFFFLILPSLHAQVKIVCIGNSITQGTMDTNFLKTNTTDTIMKSWRYNFWYRMDSANIKFDMIGRLNKLDSQKNASAKYPVSKITSHVFDSAHEARWAANADSLLKVLPGFLAVDTPDIAILQVGGTNLDTASNSSKLNYTLASMIALLQNANPSIYIFVPNVVTDTIVSDSIEYICNLFHKSLSPVKMVDIATDWDEVSMGLDSIIPDTTGERFVGKKIYDAVMSLDAATTTNSPSGLKFVSNTINSITISWTNTITPSADIFSGYDIIVNGKKVNKGLVKENTYEIRNLDIVTEYNVQVIARDYKTNTTRSGAALKMSTAGYKVNIIALNNSAPVKDAKVRFNSIDKMTNVDGLAAYTDVPPGQKSFTIEKTGLKTYNSGSKNIQRDTTFTVDFGKLGFIDNTSDIDIFPIPTNGFVTITNANQSELRITDINGTVVVSNQISSDNYRCDLSKLSSGSYILVIIGENYEKKVIITIFE